MENPLQKRSFLNVLNDIDRFLSVGDEEARKLWNVMSALRGPDSEDNELKRVTTVHIRVKAFPETADKASLCKIHLPGTFIVMKDFKLPEGRSHFKYHIEAAAKALEIIK